MQSNESALNDVDNISLSKQSANNSFKLKMNSNEDLSIIQEDSGYTQATTDDQHDSSKIDQESKILVDPSLCVSDRVKVHQEHFSDTEKDIVV